MTTRIDRLAIGFVTYHPSPDFLHRLALLSQLGCQVYLFDNSPEVTDTHHAARELAGVTYICAGKNVGLGFALSVVCGTAYSDSHPALLFFDQDTVFSRATISHIESFLVNAYARYAITHLAIVFSAKPMASAETFPVHTVDVAISSGSMFVLANLKRIGWHNEHYFVDGVDYEVGLKAKMHGLRIGLAGNTPGFDHVSEQPDREVRLLGKMLRIRKYTTARIKDATMAYAKLVGSSVQSGEFSYAKLMLRSFLIYLLGQLLARLTFKNNPR